MSPPTALPQRLAAPPAGWSQQADVVIVGSGIAGLSAALGARDRGLTVALVTKTHLDAGSTRWAQGGIAAALDPDDSPEEHLRDTLVAGVGLCDERAVRVLVTEGPRRVRELIALGASFDRTAAGDIALTREGGHRRDRIAHAGGDATGLEIERALIAAIHSDPGIEVIEHALVLDLLQAGDGHACGVTLHVIGEGQRDGVGAIRGRAVVLATGGLGQVYSATTNPAVSTGDGVALALRAGAVVADLEFVQFHPTVLWLGDASRGQQPLVSEAVRGEGAVLIDDDGKPFMQGVHEQADLAPRDVVAKAIMHRMRETGTEHVWLDARHLGADGWRHRFPTILASCRERGIDPATDLIPVAPACHYASGGVRTDLDGRTSVPGLYACGEVACTGVHGANRLASNSLLEGLVFAARIVDDLDRELPAQGTPAADQRVTGLLPDSTLGPLQRAMTEGAGVLRSAAGLAGTATALRAMGAAAGVPGIESWEATNLHTVSTALVAAAALREETRGSHWREDFPDRDDATWAGHLLSRLEVGKVVLEFSPGERRVISSATTELLTAADLPPQEVAGIIERALAEDLGGGIDVTSVATIPAGMRGEGAVVARAAGVAAGVPVAAAVLEIATLGEVELTYAVGDGTPVLPGDVLITATAAIRDLLTAERTMLNLLGRLSGIATLTQRWVDAVEGTGARIRDTRKTTPGLRVLEKYAVRCGGGVNHRMSLSDAAMVKDNHALAAGGVVAAFELVRAAYPGIPLEVEADTVEDAVAAVEAGADLVLLDNMPAAEMRRAVQLVAGRARLEASGGLRLENAREVADTGVDYLAVGALTHSAPVLDIAFDLPLAG